MKKPVVWASRAMMDSSLVKPTTSDLFQDDRDTFRAAMAHFEAGERIPEALLPKQIIGAKDRKRLRGLPDISTGSGFWIVSTAMADVFRQFDLGDITLHPIDVLQKDRKTPVEGSFELLNFVASKETFLPEQTDKSKLVNAEKGIWTVSPNLLDDAIALRETALQGPDLWCEIPKPARAFFLSDRLAKALKAAKLTRRLGLRRCRIVKDH